MKKVFFISVFITFSVFTIFAQETVIKGSVKDAITDEPIAKVTITFEETGQTETTDSLGQFKFSPPIPFGEQMLRVYRTGFLPKRYPIIINEGKTVDIQDMTLEVDRGGQVDLFTITLSEEELNDDLNSSDNVSGLLSSSRDIFQRTVAFEFSSSFFRVRGLDSDNGNVLINGIEMNKFDTGRPQWGNWGGLNDVVRNQEFSQGLTPSAHAFGGVLGTTNISTRATAYREGGQITYSSSNRSYTNRLMAKYATGLMKNGLAFTLMAGRRWGEEGFQDATLYDANSFFVAIEKKINNKHSINFTSIYAPNIRGRTSPNTQEVVDLKGIKYNEYWGYLDGKKQNSRIREIEEPILQLSYFWDINSKSSFNTTFAYQFGKRASSRLDFPGGANTSPAYYQNLPSYHLSQINNDGPNYASAFLAQQEFVNNGQVDWNSLFEANIFDNVNPNNPSAAYALYDDRTDDKTISFTSLFNTEINENILFNGGVNYRNLRSQNFAEIVNLLGSNRGISNTDAFSQQDFDLLNPNKVAGVGDKFRYNFNLYAKEIGVFAQAQFKYNKIDFFIAANITKTQYQREGLYKNGNQVFNIIDAENNVIGELDNSSGKGKKLNFTGYGAKGGFTYKISGKHLVDVNAGYLTQAPNLRNTYTNSRESQDYVGVTRGQNFEGVEITEEKTQSIDVSYIFRSPIVTAKLTGFYTKIEDANEVSFFFTQGATASGFIQETLAGVDKRHIGAELGIEAQVSPTIKLKGAASVGEYIYNNNPFVYLTSTSDDFLTRSGTDGSRAVEEIYKTSIKDYKIAGGPQRAYSVGFEYRDPSYWWFGATANFFSNTYVDISPLARSSFFTQDSDGNTFSDYDSTVARELLRQEEIEDYMVVNLVGGKSWKVGNKFIGFFVSIGNVLDTQYRTGGFEQGRTADYRALRDDNTSPGRVFAPKYFFGRGANYFLNCYVRF